MRTLNKVLCLVLAVVMCFGLLSISANAFTDDDTIQYKAAVGVMVGIGAIDGYDDGSFKPTGAVKRSEAAKMLTYAILGPDVAKNLTASATAFADVAVSEWYAPYVAYCNSKGIITGTSATTFAPDASVTSYQLAKMILVSAGYGALEEYEGESWRLNVATDAFKFKVFDGTNETNFDDAATREETALYIFNGLMNIGQVAYNEMFGYYPKNGTFTTPMTAASTISNDVYGMMKKENVMLAGEGINTSKKVYTTFYYPTTAAGAAAQGVVLADVDSDYALYGHVGTVYYGYATNANGSVDKPYKFYAFDDQSTVVTATPSSKPTDLKKAVGTATYATAANFALGRNVAYFTNYALQAGEAANQYSFNGEDAVTTATSGAYIVYNNAIVAKGVVAKELEKLDVTVNAKGEFIVKIVGGATIYNNTTAYINTNGKALNDYVYKETIDWSKFIKDFEVGVAATGSAYYAVTNVTVPATLYYLEDITIVEGTASAVATNKITINGKAYDYADVDGNTALFGTGASCDAGLLSGTYKFYIGLTGEIFYIKVVEASDSKAYAPVFVIGDWAVENGVTSTGAQKYDYYIMAVGMDGTLGTYTLAAYKGEAPSTSASTGVSYVYGTGPNVYAKGDENSFKLASIDGDKLYLKDLDSTYAVGDAVLTGSKVDKASTSFGGHYLTAATAFVGLENSATGTTGLNPLLVDESLERAKEKASVTTFADVVSTSSELFADQTVYGISKKVSGVNNLVGVVGTGAVATADAKLFLVVAFNGQVTTGANATYSYTLVATDGTKENYISTTNDSTLVGKFVTKKSDTSLTAYTAGQVATGIVSTATVVRVASDYRVTVPGGREMIATNAVVIDVRENVLKGKQDAITSLTDITANAVAFVYDKATSPTSVIAIYIVG